MAPNNEKIISLSGLKYFLDKLKNIFIVKKDDNCGSPSKPIYLKDGELIECDDIVGGGSVDAIELEDIFDDVEESITIKTINGESLWGTGDIKITSGGSVDAVELEDIFDDVEESITIKTINGESLWGTGDIVAGSVDAVELEDIFDEAEDIGTPIVNIEDDVIELNPNMYYKKTSITDSLTITLKDTRDDFVHKYLIEFIVPSSGITVNLPSNIKWLNGELPIFENNYTYKITIINNLGICNKFA